MEMGILEPSSAPYSNWWFTMPKKNGTLRFIQDLEPVNKVTIRNAGIGPTIDDFAEAFAGRSIYSVGDLYSGYDQFQLAVESRDLTTMRTPLGLVRMCTLPQGGTNSVAHMVNAMNKVLRDCGTPTCVFRRFWVALRLTHFRNTGHVRIMMRHVLVIPEPFDGFPRAGRSA
jgi:hypothetical protein